MIQNRTRIAYAHGRIGNICDNATKSTDEILSHRTFFSTLRHLSMSRLIASQKKPHCNSDTCNAILLPTLGLMLIVLTASPSSRFNQHYLLLQSEVAELLHLLRPEVRSLAMCRKLTQLPPSLSVQLYVPCLHLILRVFLSPD